MALKSNFPKFIASVKVDLQKRELQDAATIREICFEAFSDIIRRSPVDTGLFRSAHALTITSPSVFKPEPIRRAPGTSGPLITATREAQAQQSLSFIKDRTERTIFITNNLEYALPLEFGSSRQAPNGVYRLAAMRAQQIINSL